MVLALSRRRKRRILKLLARFRTLCESEIVLRGWLIGGIFIITISAFLLGVKANLFCIDGL